jgi:hypothetical protein
MIHTRRVQLPLKGEEGQQRGWWVFAEISRWVQFLNQSLHLAKGNVEKLPARKKTHTNSLLHAIYWKPLMTHLWVNPN